MINSSFVLVALAAAMSVYFGVAWYGALAAERAKTEVQKRQERILYESHRIKRLPWQKRLAARTAKYGWPGPVAPLAWGVTLVYLIIAVALTLLGLGGLAGGIAALPVSIGVGLMVASSQRAKRQRIFQTQLVAAFDQFAGQLRTASSPAKAFDLVVPGLPEPLRSELTAALDQHRAAKPLSEAMEEVAERYPSRAMHLFVSALRIDESRGGRLAPALEQASEILRREFELVAESNAEIAQERMQFFGVVGIVSFIALSSVMRGGEEASAAFTSWVGAIVLTVFVANFAFGIFRVLRIFSKVKGGY
jgi:tight adherence protein B